MNNLENNLSKIKIKELTEENKEFLWHSIMVRRIEEDKKKRRLLEINIFNYSMKKIIVGFLALVVILGGGGVVAASNNSVPGSQLFPVGLALENMQIKLASKEKKEELRLRFVEERFEEIREVFEKRTVPSNALVANLSEASTIEIEVDVFTNETTVKIEADNKNYGYISTLKVKAELIKEISFKYSLAEEKVSSVIDFETDDRESKANDKGFLNKTHSINFSKDESEDVGLVLSDIDTFLNQVGDDQNKEELKKSLAAILVLLGDDGKLEIRRDGWQIKIETENGEVKIEMENKEKNSLKSLDDNNKKNDDKKDNDRNDDKDNNNSVDDDSDDDSDNAISTGDVKEDDSEVFCRGEWRDTEDCEENDSDDNDDEDDGDNNEDDGDDEDEDESDSDDGENDENDEGDN